MDAWSSSKTKHVFSFSICTSSLYYAHNFHVQEPQPCFGGEGYLYFRLDIILVKRLSKHTLSTYFPGMKIDPKHMFFASFFLDFTPFIFSKFVTIGHQKTTFFFNCGCICTPEQCTRVHCQGLKSNRTYMIFLQGWHPTANISAPNPAPPIIIWKPLMH